MISQNGIVALVLKKRYVNGLVIALSYLSVDFSGDRIVAQVQTLKVPELLQHNLAHHSDTVLLHKTELQALEQRDP